MEKERRSEKLLICISESERRRIEQKMRELGVKNMSAYIRKMSLDGYCIHLDLADIRELVRLLRICSNNLNQYAKVANATGNIHEKDILELQGRLDDIWAFAKTIMKELADIK